MNRTVMCSAIHLVVAALSAGGCGKQQVPTPVVPADAVRAPGTQEPGATPGATPVEPPPTPEMLYGNVLTAAVRGNSVDYAAVKATVADLDAYRAWLAKSEVPTDKAARMAHYINAYNAWTLALVIDKLPADTAKWANWSIKDAGSAVQSVWKKYEFELAGKRYSLDQLEHELIRPMGDPRIHFAINCASRSCPALSERPYSAATLDAHLEEGVTKFFADKSQVRFDGKRLRVNPILDWFGEDFKAAGGVAKYIAQKTPDETLRAFLAKGGKVSFFDYDWKLNGVSPTP